MAKLLNMKIRHPLHPLPIPKSRPPPPVEESISSLRNVPLEYCIVIEDLPEIDISPSLSPDTRRAFDRKMLEEICASYGLDSRILASFRMGPFDRFRPRPLKVIMANSHMAGNLVTSFHRHSRCTLPSEARAVFIRRSKDMKRHENVHSPNDERPSEPMDTHIAPLPSPAAHTPNSEPKIAASSPTKPQGNEKMVKSTIEPMIDAPSPDTDQQIVEHVVNDLINAVTAAAKKRKCRVLRNPARPVPSTSSPTKRQRRRKNPGGQDEEPVDSPFISPIKISKKTFRIIQQSKRSKPSSV